MPNNQNKRHCQIIVFFMTVLFAGWITVILVRDSNCDFFVKEFPLRKKYEGIIINNYIFNISNVYNCYDMLLLNSGSTCQMSTYTGTDKVDCVNSFFSVGSTFNSIWKDLNSDICHMSNLMYDCSESYKLSIMFVLLGSLFTICLLLIIIVSLYCG